MRILEGGLVEYACPFAETYRTATATHEERRGLLVQLATDAGVLGLGEAAPLSNRTESLAEAHSAMEGALNTLDTDEPSAEQALEDLDALVPEARTARFALSLALEDALARHEQRPLADRLAEGYPLTDEPAGWVPVNATIPDDSPEATREKARRAAEEGFASIKLKGGREELAHDVERIEAVLEAAPDARIRLDVNQAWSSVEVARRNLERLAGYPIEYVEQPLPAEDLEGMARLRGDVDVPLAADEPVRDVRSARATILARACDVLVVKPMVLGGLDRALTVAELAAREAVDVVVTTTIDGAVARAGTLHLAAALGETPRAHGLATGELLTEEPAGFDERIEEGRMRVPEDPGHGAQRRSGETTVRYREGA